MSCLIFCFDPDIMHHETLKHIWGVKHNRNVGLYVGQLLKIIQYNYSEYQGERQIFMFREQIYIGCDLISHYSWEGECSTINFHEITMLHFLIQ